MISCEIKGEGFRYFFGNVKKDLEIIGDGRRKKIDIFSRIDKIKKSLDREKKQYNVIFRKVKL